jgi:hypothetical protein
MGYLIKRNLWLVAAAMVGHGVFDFFHHFFIDNPGMPDWWPGFCLAFDVIAGAWLMVRLMRSPAPPIHAETGNRGIRL